MRFLGFDLDQRIPDAKTIWLFRETLAQAQVMETLFAHVETYLAQHGLQPRGGQFLEASLVPVPKQTHSRAKNATIKVASVHQSGSVNPPSGGRKTRGSLDHEAWQDALGV